ncbi:hypothetical protein [Cupriavidus basilensis]
MRASPPSNPHAGHPKPGSPPRRNFAANLWIYYSNKNRQLLRIEGDVPFMHCVLMEGDPDIVRYTQPAFHEPGGDSSKKVCVTFSIAQDRAGAQIWFGYSRGKAADPDRRHAAFQDLCRLAGDSGAACRLMTDSELERQRCLFDNWLVLSRAMTAARSYPRQREAEALAVLLARAPSFELTVALHQPECDPAIMLAIIARQLQVGRLTADLKVHLLSASTIVRGSPS